jgi:hypothetical protein
MTLHIMLDGSVRYSSVYRPENMSKTADAIRENLPVLRQIGRVAIFVRDGNILHLIVAG